MYFSIQVFLYFSRLLQPLSVLEVGSRAKSQRMHSSRAPVGVNPCTAAAGLKVVWARRGSWRGGAVS